MLATAKAHFDQDVARSRALLVHSTTLAAGVLQDDVLRASWMMAVGACDAYFSDAYADLVSRALRAKELQPAIQIPDRLNNLRVPVTAILREANGGWRWRMAARELVETENVLSITKIKSLFNHFYRDHHKLLTTDTLEDWILHPNSEVRLFGKTRTKFRALTPAQRGQEKKLALKVFEARFESIFQRRHDCIHNCDRPKFALQGIEHAHVDKAAHDIEFLVHRCHESFLVEFPQYLQLLGFSGATRNQVCQG
jgi:hypothetical protein